MGRGDWALGVGGLPHAAQRGNAARAASLRDAAPPAPTIAHTDWSGRNIRLRDGALVAVYDWDSLALVPEGAAVGQAAATWRATGQPEDPAAPPPEEVDAYVSAYEAAAGCRLARSERRRAMASALWVIAYTARCEHALEAATGVRATRGRARLAESGESFLADT